MFAMRMAVRLLCALVPWIRNGPLVGCLELIKNEVGKGRGRPWIRYGPWILLVGGLELVKNEGVEGVKMVSK